MQTLHVQVANDPPGTAAWLKQLCLLCLLYIYMCVCIYNLYIYIISYHIMLYHHYMIMWYLSLSLSPSPSPWFINVYHYLAWEAVSILQPEKRLRATCQVFGSGTASQQSDASLTVGKWPEPAIGIGIILCKPPDYTKWQTSWILMALKYFITYPGRSVDDRVWTPGVSQPCTPWVRENACGKLLRQTSICRLLLDAMWIAMWISIWDNLSAYIHILGSTHIYHISIYVYINPKFPKQRTSTNLVLLVDHMHWCQGFRATETGNPSPITAVNNVPSGNLT